MFHRSAGCFVDVDPGWGRGTFVVGAWSVELAVTEHRPVVFGDHPFQVLDACSPLALQRPGDALGDESRLTGLTCRRQQVVRALDADTAVAGYVLRDPSRIVGEVGELVHHQ